MSEHGADLEALMKQMIEHITNGGQPVVEVVNLNVLATSEGPDKPSSFVLSFAGTDRNHPENGVAAVHAVLDGTLVAQLMEQLLASAIAEYRFAITGERTVVERPDN